jgi:hypothetical protein
MSDNVKWHGNEWLANFRRTMFRKLDKLGAAVAAKVRENIDETGPHEGPGEFPHKYSGGLQASVGHRVNMGNDSVEVFATAPYADEVEARRPFLRRTFAEMVASGEARKIIKEG